MTKILSVSEITKLIKCQLEENFSDIKVEGEISNLKMHASGHWYFNLKDSDSLICCTMWRSYNNLVFFTPEDGMKIIVNGKLSVYAPRGSYQIDVRSMKPAGEGELQAAFERLKRKLAAEGLFDAERKKAIPQFPKRIGIVTAIDGAAVRDMISVAKRRYSICELVIASCKVQGEGAAESIAEKIEWLNEQNQVDVIIIGRGGGSLEDLWAFNEEIVARAIFNSNIPVVSAVGHEIDFTISDFVSDMRAPTPTAAMELITPNLQDYFSLLNNFLINSTNNISYILEDNKNQVEYLLNSYGFRVPLDKVRRSMQDVDNIIYKIDQKIEKKILSFKNKTELLQKHLEKNDVGRILEKGFTIIKQNGKVIKRALEFNDKENLNIKFYDNEVEVKKL